jgi:hypothetical protein
MNEILAGIALYENTRRFRSCGEEKTKKQPEFELLLMTFSSG